MARKAISCHWNEIKKKPYVKAGRALEGIGQHDRSHAKQSNYIIAWDPGKGKGIFMKNIYGKEIENVYEKNETMRLLGKQFVVNIFWLNSEVRKQVEQISEARRFSFTLDAACDLFMLGYIHGKRAERVKARRRMR